MPDRFKELFISDGFYFAAGFLTSFIVVIGLWYLVIWRRMLRKGRAGQKYDERQEFVHGKGYKYAFITLMFYDLIYVMLDSAVERKFIDGCAAVFLGVCIAVAVYASYCIWNESYFGLDSGRTGIQRYCIIIFGSVGILNLCVGIRNIVTGAWIADGVLTFESANLFCGIMMLLITIEILVKRIRDGKEEE